MGEVSVVHSRGSQARRSAPNTARADQERKTRDVRKEWYLVVMLDELCEHGRCKDEGHRVQLQPELASGRCRRRLLSTYR